MDRASPDASRTSTGTMATMLPDGRRLGAHLPVADGMVKAAERAVEIGASTLQVFSDNPTAWDRRGESSPEIPAFRDLLARHDIAPLVIHGSYLINLAGDDDAFHEGSVRLLAAELEAARRFKASYINIHAGSHRGTGLDAGIDRLVDGIAAALAAEESTGDEAAPIVTLENSSGGPRRALQHPAARHGRGLRGDQPRTRRRPCSRRAARAPPARCPEPPRQPIAGDGRPTPRRR